MCLYPNVFIAVTCVATRWAAQPMLPLRVQPSNQFKTFDIHDSRLPIAVCYCLRASGGNEKVITNASEECKRESTESWLTSLPLVLRSFHLIYCICKMSAATERPWVQDIASKRAIKNAIYCLNSENFKSTKKPWNLPNAHLINVPFELYNTKSISISFLKSSEVKLYNF